MPPIKTSPVGIAVHYLAMMLYEARLYKTDFVFPNRRPARPGTAISTGRRAIPTWRCLRDEPEFKEF